MDFVQCYKQPCILIEYVYKKQEAEKKKILWSDEK